MAVFKGNKVDFIRSVCIDCSYKCFPAIWQFLYHISAIHPFSCTFRTLRCRSLVSDHDSWCITVCIKFL